MNICGVGWIILKNIAMNSFVKYVSTTCLALVFSTFLTKAVSLDLVPDLFAKQVLLYPQEKLYAQTDKPYYLSGETVWFRVYLVDNMSLIPDTTSRYVYAELVNPNDSLVTRVKIRPSSGAYHGYIYLSDKLPAGDYQLRFYTRYMENLGEDYFYRKRITIGNPGSGKYKINTSVVDDKGDLLTELRFVSKSEGEDSPIQPQNVRIRNHRGLLDSYSLVNGNVVRMERDTSYMKNNVMYVEYDYQGGLYRQYINIPVPDSLYDVSFFPEGGTLPAGTLSRIAFKALNPDGLGVPVNGYVLNRSGDTIVRFASNRLGMGVFPIVADKGDVYTAVCTNDKNIVRRFRLPVAESKAIVLHAARQNDNINFAVNSSSDLSLPQDLRLVIHCRGRLFYNDRWDLSKDYLSFDSKSFPSGILHAILTDSGMNPISERLVFNMNSYDIVRTDVSTDKQNYNRREKIVSYIDLKDMSGQPLSGSFSVSVTDDGAVLPDSTNTIFTTLLLTSDLRGYIEDAGWYFTSEGFREQDMDVLMLTQGWRRYDIPSLFQGHIARPEIDFETGPGISGEVKGGLTGRPIKGADVTIFAMEEPFVESTSTDSAGRFVFNNFELPDSTRYMVKGANKRDRGAYDLRMDKVSYPDITIHMPPLRKQAKTILQQYVSKYEDGYIGADGLRHINIEDIIVKGEKPENMLSFNMRFGFSNELTAEEIEGSYNILHVIQSLGTWYDTTMTPPDYM